MSLLGKDEITPIKVNLTKDGHAILLTPSDDAAAGVLRQILDATPGSLTWYSMGNTYEGDAKERVTGCYFACGGTSYMRTEGNVSETDYRGAIKVYLDVSDVDDRDATFTLRDYAYFTGVIVDPESTPQEFRLLPSATCKVCNGRLATFVELEWRVCDDCSSKCEHEYVEGVGHANGRIAYLPFCKTCGRVDPNWTPSEDPDEDLIRNVSEGSLTALLLKHPDGTLTLIRKQ